MGIWKVGVTTRLRPELRDALIKVAALEHRSMGNLNEMLIEWAFERLMEVGGSTERLRKIKLKKLENAKG